MEGIGALPMDLLQHDIEWLEVPLPRYGEICELFDQFDKFLDSHPTVGTAMNAVRGHLDAKFDGDSLTEYRAALALSARQGSAKPFNDYVDGQHYRADAHANYEG
jgi:hypothetical protein